MYRVKWRNVHVTFLAVAINKYYIFLRVCL